jgi:hypothetical protein
MADIFLSYAAPDANLASEFRSILSSRGYSIHAGGETLDNDKNLSSANTRFGTHLALYQASGVIVLWSRNSPQLTGNLMSQLLEVADSKGLLIPALFGNATAPSFASNSISIDFSKSQRAAWSALLARLNSLVGARAPHRSSYFGDLDVSDVLATERFLSDVVRDFFQRTGLRTRDRLVDALIAGRDSYLANPNSTRVVPRDAFAAVVWEILLESNFPPSFEVRMTDVAKSIAQHRACPLLWFC